MSKPNFVIYAVVSTWALMPLPALSALSVNPPLPITHLVTVQPIIVSDSDGSNTAEMFGNASQSAIIESLIDTIWAQAGIDVKWLAPNYWSNSTANSGGYSLSSLGSLGASAGVANADPFVLNVYFSEITVDGSDRGENSVNGLGWVGANGINLAVGDSLVTWLDGQEIVASVVSHEIGHNLGLDHASAPNLMAPGDSGETLNSSQISAAWSSNFSQRASAEPADFSGDGFVDQEDLRLWESGFGTNVNATQPNGDADADGDIDGNDFLLWQRAVDLPNTIAVSTSVPEPSSLLLGFLAATCLLWSRIR